MSVPSHRKKFAFRLLAVLIGLVPLLIAELLLRTFGLGRPTDFDDPFAGFSEVHPLFVLNEDTGEYEIPESRRSHFRPDSFPAEKPDNGFRVFVLGGSTVQGRPYSTETSFTTWLELSLNAADPSRDWDVINCGGVSYASYRLVPILKEILGHEPDLIVVCTGQNEFLEDRSYAHIKDAPEALAWPQRQVSRLRTYNMLRGTYLMLADESADDPEPARPELGPESDAMLDWKGGIDKYKRDPGWQRRVIAHFEFNLRRMAYLADVAGVPMVFVNPVSNLEWPPFKPEHRDGISEAEEREFDALIERSRGLADDPEAALEALNRAVAIDDQHALARYRIGIYHHRTGRFDEAREALTRAKDLDVCPLRMLEPMHQLVRTVAEETGTPLVDATGVIAAHSRSGFPDNQWLVDHVHPTVAGHQLIAAALAEELAGEGFLSPAEGWEAARDAAYTAQLDSLDEAYFTRGKRRLQAVQEWAHGKAPHEKP